MNYLLKSSCSNSEKILKTEKSKILKNKNNKIKDYNYKKKIYEPNFILIPNQTKPNMNFDYKKNILLEPKKINSPKKTKPKREISIKNNCLSARKLLKENHLINNIKAKNEFFSLEKYLSSSTVTSKKKKNNFFINEDTYDLLKTSFSSSEKILKTEKSKIFNNNNHCAKNKNTKDHFKNKKNNYLFFSGQKKIKCIQNNPINGLNYKKTIQNSQKILHTISNKSSNKKKFVFNENFIVDRCIDIIKKNFEFIEKETENFKNNTNKIKQKFLFINIYKNKINKK